MGGVALSLERVRGLLGGSGGVGRLGRAERLDLGVELGELGLEHVAAGAARGTRPAGQAPQAGGGPPSAVGGAARRTRSRPAPPGSAQELARSRPADLEPRPAVLRLAGEDQRRLCQQQVAREHFLLNALAADPRLATHGVLVDELLAHVDRVASKEGHNHRGEHRREDRQGGPGNAKADGASGEELQQLGASPLAKPPPQIPQAPPGSLLDVGAQRVERLRRIGHGADDGRRTG